MNKVLINKHHLIFIQKVQCNDKGPLERSSCKVIVQNYIRFSLYLFMYYNLQIFSLIKHSLNSFHLSHVYLNFLVLHFFQTLFDILMHRRCVTKIPCCIIYLKNELPLFSSIVLE